MDYENLNRLAWDEEVRRNNFWTRIAAEEEIEKAKLGRPEIRLSPLAFVPQDWIFDAKGKDLLLLAGGGGQQTPIMSAFGSIVTTVDISEGQLDQDRKALERYGLSATLIQHTIEKLPLKNESFDYILNPVSLCFISDIEAVFSEAFRVLRKNGVFIFGIANPVLYIFDERKQERKLSVKYTLPFSDEISKSRREQEKMKKTKDTFEYSHTLSEIIGGILDAGFIIDGFYSDKADSEPTDSFIYDSYLVFRARKI